MRPFLLAMLMGGLVLAGCGGKSPSPTVTSWPSRTVAVRNGTASTTLTVELATTLREREQGLMFRQSLSDSQGMLFLFPADGAGGFWMANTYVPLTIAYLAADGTVLEMRDGKPLDQTILTPRQPYRDVLEVSQGWFDRHGLGVGSQVILPADLPAAE
ncbi:MAG TPA: DUF192 domain-containing protein [Tepidiformaceae bacterium]